MKIILTFTNKYKKVDFLLNDEMIIKDAIKTIIENTEFKIDKEVEYIYSKRKHEKVNINYTFNQAKIFTGDELVVGDLNNE
ncbi:MAG: hypothetical protein ACLR9T_02435 [Thomasclavelia sp.]|uniref:hypothetical protein n=1 Tax=Thomasclavelia sp. TaxID=3025757 RepID=UPI0039A2CD4A